MIRLVLPVLLQLAPQEIHIEAGPDDTAVLEAALAEVTSDPVPSRARVELVVPDGGPVKVSVHDPASGQTLAREIDTQGPVTAFEAEEAALVVGDAIAAIEDGRPLVEEPVPAPAPTPEPEPSPPAPAKAEITTAPAPPPDVDEPTNFFQRGVQLGWSIGPAAVLIGSPMPVDAVGPAISTRFDLGLFTRTPSGAALSIDARLGNDTQFLVADRYSELYMLQTALRLGGTTRRLFYYAGLGVGAGVWDTRGETFRTTRATFSVDLLSGFQVRVAKRLAVGMEVLASVAAHREKSSTALGGLLVVKHYFERPRRR